MMDFNSTASVSGQISVLVDAARSARVPASRFATTLAHPGWAWLAERALQYEFAQAPVDYGRDVQGRILRIFERGHVNEECMVGWLRDAGFDLRTHKPDGEQFGFSVADGRLQGHIDGVFVGGPEGFDYPALWENKSSARSPGAIWRRTGSPFPSLSTRRKSRCIRPFSNYTSTRRFSRR